MPLAVFSRRLSWILILLLGLVSSGCRLISAGATEAAAPAFETELSAAQPTRTPQQQATAALLQPSPDLPTTSLETPASTPTRISAARTATPAVFSPTRTQESDAALLPASGFDVLYLRRGSLYRWSHLRKQVEAIFGPSAPGLNDNFQAETQIYPGEVVEFATDGQQRRLVALVDRGISANGVSLYDLLLVNLERATARTLLAEIRRISQLSLSPDGSQLVYLNAASEELYRLSLDGDAPPRVIAACRVAASGDCIPAWSVSGKYLAWTDVQGIWQTSAPDWQPALASPLLLSMADIDGSRREVQVRATSLAWAPFDRYLLAEVTLAGGEPRWLAVVDMRTGKADEVPGSNLPAGSGIPAGWFSDGRLVTLRAAPGATSGSLQVDIWQVFPTRQPLLTLQSSSQHTISAVEFTDIQIFANRFVLFRAQAEGNLSGWLARLDLEFSEINWKMPLPGGVYRTVWSPDGSGAFLQAAPDIGLYAPVGDEELFDLRGWFGDELSNLTWCLATGKTFSEGSE